MNEFVSILLTFIKKHPYQILFALIFFIGALIIATLGIGWFLFIAAVTVIGYFVGRYKDNGWSLRDIVKKITSNKYK